MYRYLNFLFKLSGVDVAANASVQVDAADPFGILITNGEFTSFVDPNFGQQVF